MPHFAVSAVGADRPGIVAAVTGVFFELGCNLEDTSMTILRGHFAMMLVVEGPADVTAGDLESALAAPAAAFDLVVTVREITDVGAAAVAGEPWSVAVYGADQPGIVHRVATVIAQAGVNIVDLTTRLIGHSGPPVYAMILEVTIPPSTDAAHLGGDLEKLAAEMGVDVSLHPSEADIL